MILRTMAATALLAVPSGLSLHFFVRLWRLPASCFSRLLLLSCASIAAVVVLLFTTHSLLCGSDSGSESESPSPSPVDGPASSHSPLGIATTVMLALNIVVFALAQLEFLAILAPFVSFPPRAAVRSVQAIFFVTGIVRLLSKIFVHMLHTQFFNHNHNLRFKLRLIVDWLDALFMGSIFALDIWLQCFLLWFVLMQCKRIRRSIHFEFKFIALTLFGFSLLALSLMLHLSKRTSDFLPDTLLVSFEFCAFQAMFLIKRILTCQRSGHDGSSISDPSDPAVQPAIASVLVPWNGIDPPLPTSSEPASATPSERARLLESTGGLDIFDPLVSAAQSVEAASL